MLRGEPFLRLDRRDIVVYRPHDGRKLRVSGGLDPVGGLPDEPSLRLRKMGKNSTQKVVVPLFRFRGDYGIIHGVAPFWLVGFASRYYTEDRREGATLFHGRSRERQPSLPSLAEKWVNSSNGVL